MGYTSSIAFPATAVGDTNSSGLYIINDGTSNLCVDSIRINNSPNVFSLNQTFVNTIIIPNDSIYCQINFSPLENLLYIDSLIIFSDCSNKSIYLTGESFLNVFDYDKDIPKEYALHPISPNPFNNSTLISFDIPNESKVELIVYNIKGQSVVKIMEGIYPAGFYSCKVELNDFSTGIYFASITANSFRKTQKMLLIK